VLVDGREPREFDAVHVPRSLSVTQTHAGVGTRAAWVVEPDADVVVLAASDPDARALARNLDVREDDEWDEGHVEGSLHVPYHELRDGIPAEIPRDEPVAVACSAGNRSSLAASLLRRAGLQNVIHVTDGGVQDLLKGRSAAETN